MRARARGRGRHLPSTFFIHCLLCPTEAHSTSQSSKRYSHKRGGRKHPAGSVAAVENAPQQPTKASSSLAELIEQDTSRMYIHLDPDVCEVMGACFPSY
jgi:hypothetical protein